MNKNTNKDLVLQPGEKVLVRSKLNKAEKKALKRGKEVAPNLRSDKAVRAYYYAFKSGGKNFFSTTRQQAITLSRTLVMGGKGAVHIDSSRYIQNLPTLPK